MIKTNIKMRVNPEQRVKVQEICFKSGIKWSIIGCDVSHIDKPYLFIWDDNTLAFGIDYRDFMSDPKEEVDADLFIRTNGTCENADKTLVKNKFMKLIDKRNKANKKLKKFAKKYNLEELI